MRHAVPAILLLALALGGCASVVADVPLVGVPANAPARPETAGTYLPVHDVPPPRQEEMMSRRRADPDRERADGGSRQGQGDGCERRSRDRRRHSRRRTAAKAKPAAKKKPEKAAKAAQ